MGLHHLMLRCHLDDPLDAVAVHCGGGSVGITLVHFFAYGDGIFWKVKALSLFSPAWTDFLIPPNL